MRKAGRVTSLGKYQLLAELARGGMGVVHLAVVYGPAGFSKLVVIKELPALLASKPELVEMFLEEARIAARLNHPNIVQTNEVGTEDERPFLAMEYLEGQSLRMLLKATEHSPRLPLSVHLHVLIDALAGLHHAHQLTDFTGNPLNVVHRDVSPHNLFVTYAGTTKVVDFGLARASDTLRNTGSGILRGKLAYMAPEQLRGDAVDRRADLFAMGVMLWEALTGRRMWRGLNELAVAQRLSSGDIPSLRAVRADAPPDLARVCERALAPDASDRYRSAREMQADIEAHLSREGKQATARGVGTLLTELFRDDRERVRALIDAQLRELREKGARTRMLSLVAAEEASSIPLLTAATASRTTQTGPVDESPPTTERLAPSTTGATVGDIGASLSPVDTSRHAVESFGRPTPIGRLAVAAASLVLAGVAIGISVTGGLPPEPRAAAAPPVEPVRLTVKATPAGARIYLDGRAVGEGAYEMTAPRDGRTHSLRVEAEGYMPMTEQLSLSQSIEVRIALERIPRGGREVREGRDGRDSRDR